MQVKTIIFVLAALVVGLVAGLTLRPLVAPVRPVATAGSSPAPVMVEPRATQYFEAHLDEAKAIVAGCVEGSVRGGECARAQYAVTEAQGRAQTRSFLGQKP